MSAAQRRTEWFCARYQAASLPLEVVLPVPLTPTRKVTFGRRLRVWEPGACGASRMAMQLSLEKIAQLLAAFDGLMAGAVAQGFEDRGGGLDAEIAGEERGFEVFEGGLVDGAGEGGDAFDFGGERLAGARDGLLHAGEEAEGGRFCLVVRGSGRVVLAAKELHREGSKRVQKGPGGTGWVQVPV